MTHGRQKRTEVSPEVVFLGSLVDRVAAGKIRVPRFQRAFVWKRPDLTALLDSVLRGFPIGSILVWETERSIASNDRIGPVKIGRRPDGAVGYLLDGQQRVSTLVGTLRLTDDGEPNVDQIEWRVHYDLDDQEFVTRRDAAADQPPRYFPVRHLLATAGFIEACRRIETLDDGKQTKRRLAEADRLSSAFRDYQLPLIRIRDADLESAVTVFARLNRTGRKMAADELVSALTYDEGEFDLARMLNEFKAELRKKGFGNLDRVLLLRSVLAALDHDIYAKDWADLMVKPEVRRALPGAFAAAKQGILRALGLLARLGITSDRLLPYGLQIVLLGEFYRLCSEPDDRAVAVLKRWFWVTSFTGWFGGVNSSQARDAVEEIRRLAHDSNSPLRVVDLEAPAQGFPRRFDARSARVRAFLLYLASLGPRSLTCDTRKLKPGALLSRLGTAAIGYLWANPSPRELVSSPANRMFVDEELHGQVFNHLEGLGDDRLAELLPTHGFPSDCSELVRNGDRTSLLKARREFLMAGERRFMQERNVSLPTEETAATVADSDTSDDDSADAEIYPPTEVALP